MSFDEDGVQDLVPEDDLPKGLTDHRHAFQLRRGREEVPDGRQLFRRRREVQQDGVKNRGGHMIEMPTAGRAIRSDHALNAFVD